MPYYFFQWTAEIIEHLAENGVLPEEFEGVVCNPVRRENSRSSNRRIVFGYADDHRYLACVFVVLEDKMTVIPVTAFEVEE